MLKLMIDFYFTFDKAIIPTENFKGIWKYPYFLFKILRKLINCDVVIVFLFQTFRGILDVLSIIAYPLKYVLFLCVSSISILNKLKNSDFDQPTLMKGPDEL